MSAPSLSPEAWSQFREEHWDRAPGVLRQPLGSPDETAAEVFRALQDASDQRRAGDASVPLQIVTQDETELKGEDLEEHLPRRSDADMHAYEARVTQRLNGGKFALLINGAQRYSPPFWQRIRRFLKPLLPLIPAAATSPAVFLGNYDRTPFGIHRDPSSIFLFVLHGAKRLRVWPGRAFLEGAAAGHSREYQSLRYMRPDVDEEAALASSTLLEGTAGDLLFFPSTYWHIGECVEGLTLSVSAGLTPLFPADDIWESLAGGLEGRMRALLETWRAPYSLGEVGRTREAIPRLLDAACRELAELGESPTLRHALDLSWLNAATAAGCQPTPPPRPWRRLEDAEVVRGSHEFPVRWIAAPDRKIALSANGYSFTLPANPRVTALAEELNRGRPAAVGRLLATHSGEGTADGVPYRAAPEGLRTVLGKLYTFRAVELCGAEADD